MLIFVKQHYCNKLRLRFHGRWIFTKNGICFAVQIEKTEINILQKEWDKKLFYFSR